ncbi:hypothetical protein ANDA3_2283 [plant metagenome]|uniref:Uncharacterized protein n=1 Tax=plant metagenome TaxID=1297885 RepID=A0A484QWX9_9ZZZZ
MGHGIGHGIGARAAGRQAQGAQAASLARFAVRAGGGWPASVASASGQRQWPETAALPVGLGCMAAVP